MEDNVSLIQLPFNGGLDERTAPEYLVPGRNQSQVLNGVFNKNGVVDKRLGTKKLGTLLIANNAVTVAFGGSARLFGSQKYGMIACSSGYLYNRSAKLDQLAGVGALPNVAAKRRELPIPSNSFAPCTVDYSTSLRMVVYLAFDGSLHASAYDSVSGNIVKQGVLLQAFLGGINNIQAFLLAGGTKIAIAYNIGGVGAYVVTYTIGTDTFAAPVQLVAGTFDTFDASPYVSDPFGGFLTLMKLNGSVQLRLDKWSSAGANVATVAVNVAGATPPIGVGANYTVAGVYNDRIWISFATVTGATYSHVVQTYNDALVQQSSFVPHSSTTTNANHILGPIVIVQPGTAWCLVTGNIGISPFLGGQFRQGIALLMSTSAASSYYWPFGYVPVAKPVVDSDGSILIPCVFSGGQDDAYSSALSVPTQQTLYLMRWNQSFTDGAYPVACVAPRQVFGRRLNQHYPMPSCGYNGLTPTKLSVVSAIHTDDVPYTGVGFAGASQASAFFSADFALDQSTLFGCDELSDGVHINGGVPVNYDGGVVVEEGFFYYTDTFGLTITASGGTWPNTTGKYLYAVVFRRTDSAGNIQRSSAQIIQSPTLTNGGAAALLSINTYSTSWADNGGNGQVWADIYRSVSGGTTLFLVDSIQVNANTTPSLAVANTFVTYQDIIPDGNINSDTILYTTGGVLDNINTPSSGCQCTYRGRLFRVDETGKTIWFSQVATPGEAIGWNEVLTFQCSEGGDVTALAVMDDKLIIFKTNSIWIVTGDGPSPTGQGSDLTLPQRIATDVGALDWRSVCLMPKGLMFQARAGIYILTRDLTVDFIGRNVEDTLAAYPTVTSAVLVPAQQHVRFTCNSNSNTHVAVFYDYLQDAWSTQVYPTLTTIGSACLVVDQWTLGDPFGNLLQERLSSDANAYKDDSPLGVPGFVQTSITTPWIYLDGLQSYQRARRFLFNGNAYNNAGVSFTVYKDGDPNTAQQYETFVGGPQELAFHVGATINKCRAIKLNVVDVGGSGNGNGYRFVGLALEVQKIGQRARKFAVGTTFAVTSITPATGPTTGGTAVTITGAGFTGTDPTTGVKFGTTPATSIVVVNDYTITCVSPLGSVGASTVTVTSPKGSGTTTFTYTYASVPTLTSVLSTLGSWAVGDIDGGYQVTLTGTNFTGATGVTFGGTPATSVVVVNPTTITCTVPAHAFGAVSVVVTTPSGSNGANTLWRYFSPAQLVLSGWWRPTYANPWAPTASAGPSGSNGNLINGIAPSTTVLNGLTIPRFDGATQYLQAASASATLLSTAAGTVMTLGRTQSQPAASANPYTDAQVFSDNGPNCGQAYSSSGFQAYLYDGAYKKTVPIAFANNTWQAFMSKWDSANINASVGGTSAAAVAAGAVLGLGSFPFLANIGFGTFAQIDVGEVIVAQSAFSNATRDDIRAYFTTRYQVSV